MIYEKCKWQSAAELRSQCVTVCGRRSFFRVLSGILLFSWLRPSSAVAAVPDRLVPLVREVAGDEGAKVGKVKLLLPPLAESGNSVPLKIRVESQMTTDNYVKSIHVFSERNPRPVIARFYLTPLSGKAEINTRIRLAGTQQVVAVAVMNDGSAWLGSADVVVTAAACIDEKTG